MLATGPAGLTSAEARARLAKDGPNELPEPKLRSPGRLLADQPLHFFAIMPWIASGLAALAGLPAVGGRHRHRHRRQRALRLRS